MHTESKAIKLKRVHWTLRVSAFAGSVLTLSWFFAGWRQIHETGQMTDWALLFGGTGATLALLFLQGYWIYFEEKQKGTLKKNIAVFEKLHGYFEQRKLQNLGGHLDEH